LLPLSDIAPEWVHPQTGWLVDEMIATIANNQMAEPVEGSWDDA
jgi:7,8-dihydro-6-hydroxymethylpterin-pyrophosphokinase